MRKPFAVILIPASALILMVATQLTASQLQAGAQKIPGPDGGKSVWDSVYAPTQADAGKGVYQDKCSACHGADLSGGRGPALRGDTFFKTWGNDNLGLLYGRMKTRMPRDAPASLKDEEYLNIVAYVLQANELPAGTRPLVADQVDQIQVYGKGGPEAPLFLLVDVVGCLTRSQDNGWILLNGSAPVKTKDPMASKGADVQKAEEIPLGDQTFQIVDPFIPPDPLNGHKVEAKGFLMKMFKTNDLSVTSLQTVAPTCEK
jgi:mono/diheme cytochrome c family protein